MRYSIFCKVSLETTMSSFVGHSLAAVTVSLAFHRWQDQDHHQLQCALPTLLLGHYCYQCLGLFHGLGVDLKSISEKHQQKQHPFPPVAFQQVDRIPPLGCLYIPNRETRSCLQQNHYP
ncbi:hypothetical protein Lepto7375DRAFT_3857 [Leptolyngbya sp. PCC 7375]|nr:hypothetical protein Lepto7375DRAFT_3857 [Leptolyngbya sp. PCC 7375]